MRKKQELSAYKQFLAKMLSESLSKDNTTTQSLLPIIQNVEVGVQSKDRAEVASVLVSVKQQIDANTKIKKAFAAGEAAFKAELKRLAAQQPQSHLKRHNLFRSPQRRAQAKAATPMWRLAITTLW